MSLRTLVVAENARVCMYAVALIRLPAPGLAAVVVPSLCLSATGRPGLPVCESRENIQLQPR
jgi:hypothetical protein